MKNKKILTIVLIAGIIFICASSYFISNHYRDADSSKLIARTPLLTNDPCVINVALYPYVPDITYMEEVLTQYMAKISPEVTLNFVDWDCYMSVNPDNIDVLMYDALFTDALLQGGYLSPLDPSKYNTDDIMNFALEQTKLNNTCYGIPNLICAYFLIHYADDTEVAQVENFYELYEVLGDAKRSPKPPRKEGFLINFSDNYPYFYFESLHDSKEYQQPHQKAPDYSNPHPPAIRTLNDIIRMIGPRQAFQSDFSYWVQGQFKKAQWFNNGSGRAYYGYSEDLSSMPEIIDELDVKFISMSDGPNHTMFYADLVSINASVTNETKLSYCEEIVRILTSEEYLYEIGYNNGTPAYLLPSRNNVYQTLAQHYPMYNELKTALDNADKRISTYPAWILDSIWEGYDLLLPHLKSVE